MRYREGDAVAVMSAIKNSKQGQLCTASIAAVVYGVYHGKEHLDLTYSLLVGLEKAELVKRCGARGRGRPQEWRLT